MVRTTWKTDDIWARRDFDLPQPPTATLHLMVHHDDDAEVYLNGVLAARLPGYVTGYEPASISPAALETLRPGANTLAIHCHQIRGGQYIDVGLVNVIEQGQ